MLGQNVLEKPVKTRIPFFYPARIVWADGVPPLLSPSRFTACDATISRTQAGQTIVEIFDRSDNEGFPIWETLRYLAHSLQLVHGYDRFVIAYHDAVYNDTTLIFIDAPVTATSPLPWQPGAIGDVTAPTAAIVTYLDRAAA